MFIWIAFHVYIQTVTSNVWLPAAVQRSLDSAAIAVLNPQGIRGVDFARPLGEAALVEPDSVSWRVFKNPIALFIGGVAAVILELAEPAVRSAIWEHSSFRQDPIGRLRRTGLAAMVSIYAGRSVSEPMIAGIVRMHAKVTGKTAQGQQYAANDRQLLTWVQATAAYSFGEAYSRFVAPLRDFERNALYGEGASVSHLYGVLDAPKSSTELFSLFDSMIERLEPSPVIFEFLHIMRGAPILPKPLHWVQPKLVCAAVDIIPLKIRRHLGLISKGMAAHERLVARLAGAAADRIALPRSPAMQSCIRLGLPSHFLYA
jgi:uncharacterized protein (DUF2236 family)